MMTFNFYVVVFRHVYHLFSKYNPLIEVQYFQSFMLDACFQRPVFTKNPESDRLSNVYITLA